MSALHLKYRPKEFEEVRGNKDMIAGLQNTIRNDEERPHSYLFHGPTGCGKTTLARIVAAELGCVGNDLREVDSADFRGIESVRDMRRQVQFKPLEGPCKIWILDEIHQQTNDAQNALLKALEDTPQHIYYILCTTEPNKLIKAIRGRCTQYQVQPLTDAEMTKLLRGVVRAEDERLDKEVYTQIIQDSLGLPRNALQILGQVLAVDDDARLGIARQAAELESQTIELCRALTNNSSWKKVAAILSGLKGQEPETIRRAVLGYCQAILLKGASNQKVGYVMECMIDPLYNSGFPGLVFACYSAVEGS